jgi:hypothetical protein
VKVTRYFEATRNRPDRAIIRDDWISRAIHEPVRESIQKDGRIRRWALVPEMENRYLRVVLLEDDETIHNAFFDRRFEP